MTLYILHGYQFDPVEGGIAPFADTFPSYDEAKDRLKELAAEARNVLNASHEYSGANYYEHNTRINGVYAK